MAILVPDAGERQALNLILGKVASENLLAKLYTSNTTPAEGDTTATYTIASGFGYADKTLASTDWTVATTTGVSSASAPQQTWTFTGALGNVYGWILVGATSGILYLAERFTTGPFNIVNNGDQIKLTPYFELA